MYWWATTKVSVHDTLPGKTDIINDSQDILQAWNKDTHHGAELRSSFLFKQQEQSVQWYRLSLVQSEINKQIDKHNK